MFAGSAAGDEYEAELKVQQARRTELEAVLKDAGSGESAEQSSDAPAKKPSASKSGFSQILNNTANGFVTVSVYFADIISDVQVLVLLYDTGNMTWALLSLFFLVAQFVAIYVRVLPYLRTTFGAESPIYLVYLWIGCPIGSLLLDILMFLEPFGLLAVLPLPTCRPTETEL